MRIAVTLCAAVLAAGATLPARADYAVAFGDNGSGEWSLGWSIDQPTKTQADVAALAKCNSDSRSPGMCKVIFSGRGTCFAFALSRTTPIFWAYAYRKTAAEADQKAQSSCNDKRNDCSVILSKCEVPKPMTLPPPLSTDEINAFRKKIVECGKDEMRKHSDSLIVDIDINLNRDGSLSRDPTIVGPINNEGQRQLADAIIKILRSCQPFTMFSTDYDGWKSIALRMKGGVPTQ